MLMLLLLLPLLLALALPLPLSCNNLLATDVAANLLSGRLETAPTDATDAGECSVAPEACRRSA
jgi:hypothetical protein